MPQHDQTIPIFADAPAKPALGAPCNGCGVCCLLEPCPLGVLLSGYRSGACRALRWQAADRLYRCGALAVPEAVLAERLPHFLRWTVPWLAAGLRLSARRWVAAGIGCDCDVDLVDGPAQKDIHPSHPLSSRHTNHLN